MTNSSAIESFVRGLVHFFRGDEDEDPSLTIQELLALRELPFLCRLTGEQQSRFFDLCGTFLDKVSIEGIRCFRPTMEDRVKVAASCALLYVGRPEWKFPPVQAAYISPMRFRDGDFEPSSGGKWTGYYRHADKTVYFFWCKLRGAFTNDRNGFHLGLHEFAHALDSVDGDADGQLPSMAPLMKSLFDPILQREMKRAGGRTAALRKYGATNISEAFATAIERFFEQPRKLKTRAPDLYVLLAMYLNQDPAAYDERLFAKLAAKIGPVVHAYIDEILDGADIREGKIYKGGIGPPGGYRRLQASYRTKHGKWSKRLWVEARHIEAGFTRDPKAELPVTVEIRNGKIHRVAAWGQFPPFLHKDSSTLIVEARSLLPDANERLLREAVLNAWRTYKSTA